MAFFELIVLVNGVEINRAYVVELARQIGNQLWQIGAGRIDIASWRDLLALQLQAQGFFERDLVRRELTQIDSITAGGGFGGSCGLLFLKRPAGLPRCARNADPLSRG